MFTSTASYPVITRGAPTPVEITVQPVSNVESSQMPSSVKLGSNSEPGAGSDGGLTQLFSRIWKVTNAPQPNCKRQHLHLLAKWYTPGNLLRRNLPDCHLESR
jgi:hypothetical protein